MHCIVWCLAFGGIGVIPLYLLASKSLQHCWSFIGSNFEPWSIRFEIDLKLLSIVAPFTIADSVSFENLIEMLY